MTARLPLTHIGLILVTLQLMAACAGAPAPSGGPARPGEPAAASTPQKKTAVFAISAPIPAFSFGFLGTSGGGAQSFNELWVQGLATSGQTNTAPIPRIAVELPSIDRGTAEVLADGRMRATWKIRPEAKWADGADLTARDFALGLEIMKSSENPLAGATLVVNIGPLVESLDIIDDKTFVMNWRSPYYLFDALGFFAFQPMPVHVLKPVWDERNAERGIEAFQNHSYWRDGFFQVGPFRPVKFEPQVEIVLEAVPHYFLGRPKLDTIVIKQFSDANVAFAGLLAGTVDVTGDNVLSAEQATELKERWDRSGEGKVYIGYGTTRGIFPMFNPEHQAEPAILDPRVRQALYTAIDRETWAATALAGRRENTAQSLMPPDHPLYEATKDSLREFRYDPTLAQRSLVNLGWERSTDGLLRSRADGRAFRIDVWTTQGSENEASILADMWKQVGVDGAIFVIPTARQGDRILRQSYPGVEISARGYGDLMFTRAECETLPRAPRFDGANRGHYCNPEMDRLIAAYRVAITRPTQGRAIGDLARLYNQELPMMPLFYNLTNPAVVKGFSALADDFAGGLQPPGFYGSYFRNSHLFEWRS